MRGPALPGEPPPGAGGFAAEAQALAGVSMIGAVAAALTVFTADGDALWLQAPDGLLHGFHATAALAALAAIAGARNAKRHRRSGHALLPLAAVLFAAATGAVLIAAWASAAAATARGMQIDAWISPAGAWEVAVGAARTTATIVGAGLLGSCIGWWPLRRRRPGSPRT